MIRFHVSVFTLLILLVLAVRTSQAAVAKSPPTQLPQISVSASCTYQPLKTSADGKKEEMAKWLVRAEITSKDKRAWKVQPLVALFHFADQKPFLPVLTIPSRPQEQIDALWPSEGILMQTVPEGANSRGVSNILVWKLLMDGVDDMYENGYDLDGGDTWLDDIGITSKPETDFSFASALTVAGLTSSWKESVIGRGQIWKADWESLTLASPDEMKLDGVAGSAVHRLIVLGPVIYDSKDGSAVPSIVISRFSGGLPTSPAKFSAAEIVPLTAKYIREQVETGPSDSWRGFFVSLTYDQPVVSEDTDALLTQAVRGYEKWGNVTAGTAGVCLIHRNAIASLDSLIATVSDIKANELMRARIIKGLSAFDTDVVRNTLSKLASDESQAWLVRFTALQTLATCPKCDWTFIERLAQDKGLQSTVKTLLEEHRKKPGNP